MAAIHGDDIFAEGEPEKLNRLDEVLKRLVDVKVLDRTGQGAMEQCQYLKKHARHGITSACCVFRRRRHAERSGAQRLQRHVLALRTELKVVNDNRFAEETPSPRDNQHKADILRPFPMVLATVDTWRQRPSV